MAPAVSIPKRKLGKTGLAVTVLGCGGAPLGGLFQVLMHSKLPNTIFAVDTIHW